MLLNVIYWQGISVVYLTYEEKTYLDRLVNKTKAQQNDLQCQVNQPTFSTKASLPELVTEYCTIVNQNNFDTLFV